MALEKTIAAADQALSQIITEALPTIGAAVDFLKAEITDVVHQLLVWKLVENLWVGAGYVSVAILACVACRKVYGKFKDLGGFYADDDAAGIIAFFLAGFLAFIGAVLTWFGSKHFLTAIQIWIAPKIYLIDYATTLYQGK